MSALPPSSNTLVPTTDPELIALYKRIKRRYLIQSEDSEVYTKLIPLLKVFAALKSNAASPPITISNSREMLSDLFNADCLFDDNFFYFPPNKPARHLPKFMCSHGVDYVGNS